MSRRDRYDPSEYAQRKAMQRDRAERIRASRSQQGGGGGGGGGGGSSGAGGGGGSSGGWAEPDARGDSRGDDLLSRLEALKSQLSTPQHADARPAPDEEPGRARSDAERARRREAEAALQRERHKHITMQDEIAGLREQVTALQNTSRPPAPAPAPERRFAASSSSSSGRGRGRSDAAESAEQKREMDEALERANRLSEERVARQQEREAAEEAERLAREAEDEAWTHVRFRPVPPARGDASDRRCARTAGEVLGRTRRKGPVQATSGPCPCPCPGSSSRSRSRSRSRAGSGSGRSPGPSPRPRRFAPRGVLRPHDIGG